MIDMTESQTPVCNEVTICVHFVDGTSFTQPIPLEQVDKVQNFMDWFRKPRRDRIFAFHTVANSEINMLHHSHIMAVDIEGYIEPEGRASRWYECLLDRFRSRRF